MDEILSKNIKFLDKDVLNYFQDNDMAKMYSEKNKIIRGEKPHNSRLELQIDIIENEIIKILEKDAKSRSDTEQKVLGYASKFYRQFYLKPFSLMTCKIFNTNVGAKLFSRDEVQKIDVYLKENRKNVKKIYDKYMNNEKLTVEEECLMFCFFTTRLGTKNDKIYNCQERLINKIISNNGNVHISGKEFLIKFITSEKCKKLKLPTAKVYISDKDFENRDIKPSTLGLSFGNTGLVVINESFVKSNLQERYDLSKTLIESTTKMNLLIHTIHHELQHYKQSHNLENNIINIGSYNMLKNRIFREYLSDAKFNEYKTNYRYRETEREANIVGWRETAEFLKKYASKDKFREIKISSYNSVKTKFDKSYAVSTNKTGYTAIQNQYNMHYLIKIIKENPSYIKEYPMLNLFFDKNGNHVKIKDMIKVLTSISLNKNIDYKVKQDYYDVYEEMLGFAFEITDLDKLNIDELSYEEQSNYFSLIADAYEKECRELKNMMDVYLSNNSKDFDVIAMSRIKKIKKYYDYLIKNQNKIDELSHKSNLRTFVNARKRSIDVDIASFRSRLKNENKYLQGTPLAHEILSLSDLSNPVVQLPTFEDLKALASKYEIAFSPDDPFGQDISKMVVKERENGKVVGKVITDNELIEKAVFANIWLVSAGTRILVGDHLPGYNYAFNKQSERLYNSICRKLATSAKKDGVIDTVDLFKDMNSNEKSVVVKLFRTPYQTNLINKIFLNSVKKKTDASLIPTTLYTESYAGGLAYGTNDHVSKVAIHH